MPAITLSPKVVSELHSLLTKPNACVTLGDADVLFDLAGRPLAELNTVWTICARIPVNSGEEKALEDQLIPGTTLGLAYPGVHFARLVLVPSRTHLVLAVIFDQSRELAINLLVRNAATLGPVLTHCTGYPANAAADPVALGAYLITHDVASRLFYVKYRWPQNVVAESVRLRRSFLSLLCDWELDLSAERDQRLPYRFDDFLVQNRQTPALSSPPTSAPPSPPSRARAPRDEHAHDGSPHQAGGPRRLEPDRKRDADGRFEEADQRV